MEYRTVCPKKCEYIKHSDLLNVHSAMIVGNLLVHFLCSVQNRRIYTRNEYCTVKNIHFSTSVLFHPMNMENDMEAHSL